MSAPVTPAERKLVECRNCDGEGYWGDDHERSICSDCSGSGLDPDNLQALEEVKAAARLEADRRWKRAKMVGELVQVGGSTRFYPCQHEQQHQEELAEVRQQERRAKELLREVEPLLPFGSQASTVKPSEVDELRGRLRAFLEGD